MQQNSTFSCIAALLCGSLLTAGAAIAAEKKNGFDTTDALVPQIQIKHGGPDRDGIPSLSSPRTVSATNANYLNADERVLGVEVNGRRRAYPIRILNYHEVVNDIVGGDAIVVTYCPLCGSGIAFDAEPNGKIVEFGVSGLLYNSDVLLYDHETESLWSQISKTAISGPLKGSRLEAIVTTHTTWQDWLERYPDTDVLSIETGYRLNYRVNPYPRYRQSGRLYFPVDTYNDAYPRKSLVMGLELEGKFKAYPFSELDSGPQQFEDEFVGKTINVIYDHDNQTASVIGADGKEISTLIAFWFAWYAFHPDTEIYSAK